MTTKQSIFTTESENEQCSQEDCGKDNISIDILNDYCLAHLFKFLPIADRLRSEKGEYSILHILCLS